MAGFFQFFKAALKNPLQLSTPFESSPRVGRLFARNLRLRDDQVVVELGVGAGAITDEVLPALKSRKQYVGFELNEGLYKFLKEKKYPDLEFHNTSAENLIEKLRGRKVGAVISTLPWSLFPKDVRERILDQVLASLDPGGTFSVFVAMHVLWAPSMRALFADLQRRFPDYTYVDEPLNLPPCRLYFMRKRD
ncbi:MAG TPA: methyltransferase domain-containing protein [Bdellovibrionales bacterium]|nr:methyltransferase domain-containing protein [Bdellovibrionales bacterium]